MGEKYPTYCHIKRPSASRNGNAYDPTLCGKEDPGLYAYVTLSRDEQIPGTGFPICTDCATLHTNEHYTAMKQAQSAHLN